MLKKFILKTLLVLFIIWGGLSCYMLYKADLSLQSLAHHRLTDKQPRLPVYLINYADGDPVFYRNQNALAYSALNKGFDHIINYRRELLDQDFRQKYQDVLAVPTGAGLWLWKPHILLATMKMAPKNSIIFYTDVGFIYVRPIDDIVHTIERNHDDIYLMNIDDYHTQEKLRQWLPKKIAVEWNIDNLPPDKQPKFIASGLIIIRNTLRAQQFVEKWLEICARKDYAFLQYDKEIDDIKGFTYDQSLLSLIAYQYPDGVKIIPQEQFKKFTVFHHRHPGNNKPLLPLQTLPAKQIREWIGQICPSFFLYFGY